MGVLRIRTDVGIEGVNFLSYPGPGPLAIAREIVTFVKPLLLGADPLQIGRHWRRLQNLGHFINSITVGVVDVALWDIAGQAAGLPIHRLLGNCRDGSLDPARVPTGVGGRGEGGGISSSWPETNSSARVADTVELLTGRGLPRHPCACQKAASMNTMPSSSRRSRILGISEREEPPRGCARSSGPNPA